MKILAAMVAAMLMLLAHSAPGEEPAAQDGVFAWQYRLRRFPGAFDSAVADDFARAGRQRLVAEVV
jgi:hypothetical protein